MNIEAGSRKINLRKSLALRAGDLSWARWMGPGEPDISNGMEQDMENVTSDAGTRYGVFGPLRENLQPSALRFDTQEDALNFAAKLVEDSKHWLAVHNLNIVKRYKEAELEIVLVCRFDSESEKFHLVLSSIPDMGSGHLKESCSLDASGPANHASPDGNNVFMLIPVTNFVECPQEVIASQVRLESTKERLHFFRQVLGSPETIGHLSGTSSERECSILRIDFASSDRYSVSGIVESVPKILHEIGSSISNDRRDFLGHFDLVHNAVRSLRVRLSNSCVWVDTSELFDFPMEISEVLLSPCYLAS